MPFSQIIFILPVSKAQVFYLIIIHQIADGINFLHFHLLLKNNFANFK